MADVTTQDTQEDIEDVADKTDEKATDTQQDKKGKVFTQAELDDIVKKRIEKERRSFKSERDTLEGDLKSARDELKEIDDSFAGEVEELSKGIDESILELFDGLSNREKVSKLKKLQGKLTKIEIKETKKASGDGGQQFTRRNTV
jgi:hypothetical protein